MGRARDGRARRSSRQTCAADRSEEASEWRHPHDLAGLVAGGRPTLPERLAARDTTGWSTPAASTSASWRGRSWTTIPTPSSARCSTPSPPASTPEQLGRAVAYAAALRIARFHTQNDLGDWNSVHHAFTAANALHQALVRCPTPELLRGAIHGALRVYLDRFLNVPAARLPRIRRVTGSAHLADLAACWDVQGEVDEAGADRLRLPARWRVAGRS